MLSSNQLCEEVKDIFGINSVNFQLFHNATEVTQGNVSAVVGKTLATEPQANNSFSSANGAICPFFDVSYNKKCATLLLQNPVGCNITEYVNDVLSTMFGVPLKSKKKLKCGTATMELNNMNSEQWKTLYGQTGELLL